MGETDRSAAETDSTPRRRMGAKGWVATLVLAMTLGGGGFYATFSGIADPVLHAMNGPAKSSAPSADAPRFLELDPMMVTVGSANTIRQLRFRAFLQLGNEGGTPVAALQPRILDIFATYLRAVPVDRLEDPTALLQLRAQLLRRVQLLAGTDAVEDLLIIDFVIA